MPRRTIQMSEKPDLRYDHSFAGDEFYLLEEAIHFALYAMEKLKQRNVPLRAVQSRRAVHRSHEMPGFEVLITAENETFGFFISDANRDFIVWKSPGSGVNEDPVPKD
ncbi:hypothetical protein [Rubinisphaera margarita]|uniref:hypothetical protein n=1 Tax=Rubinisphaera margarita TaxID=2909586 RepID=UPI001EE85405|nr:hypothetical protein [Rubinisphaera margarita]MCG6157637.1 hypothetical protein [Rubinisphaera margarita]